MTNTICPSCGGTGERHDGQQWRGNNCPTCEGWGELVIIKSKTYPFGPNGKTYRNEKGQYQSIGEYDGTNRSNR